MQVIHLMQGISSIVGPVESYLLTTPFRSTMLPAAKDPYAPLDPGAEAFLADLRALASRRRAA